ncbi:alanyl-tRNA editing protein AlaX [Brevibacillus sp. SKDU10]|uniref:alanyl-tRNA editing protein n=1 Tax=Brevibacillus sp. SKDU10 TaxID=1247872 RepID=UPI0007C88474|nr:DHHA1 domain-containing protein [Brevibacillus sp. SKDU10]OAJ75490.1 alanyl-tRNA editing protein AlaX [Brevibacillus sp. SKDU10]
MLISATTKLYYQNPYWRECTATVLHQVTDEFQKNWVAFDQTIFYPTGGGQPHDTGYIGQHKVLDVEEREGVVWHHIESPLTSDQKQIQMSIDWDRRFDHMQQHAGQHILSAAFAEEYRASTIGFHLGQETCTIDLDIKELTEEMVKEVEAYANQIVFENRDIIARFVHEEELEKYPLRKKPTVEEDIRLVIIPDFDYNPCGGTHPNRTGEVGPILILQWEKHKGHIRLEFTVGKRTVERLHHKHALLRQVSRLLQTNEAGLQEAVLRLQAEQEELADELLQVKEALFSHEKDMLIRHAEQLDDRLLITQRYEERPLSELQKIAQLITGQEANAIVLLITGGAKQQFVCACGKEADVEMNTWVKRILPRVEGKGGGNALIAQGGAASPYNPDQIHTYAREELQALLEK